VFEGTYTALVTPFSADGIDYPALRRLIDAQVAAGVQGVVPCGSTGESATLSHDEHERVISAVVEHVAGRVKVIAGTGSNSTRESVRLTRWAKEHGADGALLIAPYYNKPTQDGLRAHYETVADGVDLPLIVYNIPGRSAVNIAPETMAKLAEIPHIVGVKEASGSLDQVSRIVQLCGSKLTVLSGDDSLTLPIMSVGGRGVIAVVSNLVPERLIKLVNAALAGDYESARAEHYALLPLMQAMGVETNPIPVKTALAMLGRCSPELRLPLTALREENMAVLRKALQGIGLSSKLS
jgi:4-hydroxy-tetrahydrodipicolinate synthase